jgi:hypothetical protein
MLKKLVVVAGFAMAMAFSTGVAHADTMTITGTANGSSCSGCVPATYTLTVTGDFATGTDLTVTMTINFTGNATVGTNNYINAVGFKLGASTMSVGGLSAAPGGAGSWSTLLGTLNNSDCNTGPAGFVCSQGSVEVPGAGNSLTWTWTGVDLGGPVSTNPSDWSIKADYGPANGLLISENTTGVPEPATVVLLGIGLIPLLGIGRRFLA